MSLLKRLFLILMLFVILSSVVGCYAAGYGSTGKSTDNGNWSVILEKEYPGALVYEPENSDNYACELVYLTRKIRAFPVGDMTQVAQVTIWLPKE